MISPIGLTITKGHFFLAILLTIIFLVVNFTVSSFSLAVPQAPAFAASVLPFSGTTGQYFVSGLTMPIFEEVVFRLVLVFIIVYLAVKWFGVKEEYALWIAIILSSVVFAGFHYWAYTMGGYVARSSPFIAAFVFGLVASIVTWKVTRNVLTALIFHIGVNLVLLTYAFSIA